VNGDGDPPDDWRRGVRPLGAGKQTPPPHGRRPGPGADRPAIAFEVTVEGERLEGHASGVDRATLRRLRRGEVEVESTLDLHGHDRDGARSALRAHLLAAAAEGQRCALVIHGRGQRSADGPVLKRQLPRWLAEAPLDRWVMAFTSATQRDGGGGALYVLLRRRML
jgi:DNA-nicking Smr family endonuclease